MLLGSLTILRACRCTLLNSDDDDKDVDDYIQGLVENCTSKSDDAQGVCSLCVPLLPFFSLASSLLFRPHDPPCLSDSAPAEWKTCTKVSGSIFDKKDAKKSKKILANFSDFWDKFVVHAPEVFFAFILCSLLSLHLSSNAAV